MTMNIDVYPLALSSSPRFTAALRDKNRPWRTWYTTVFAGRAVIFGAKFFF